MKVLFGGVVLLSAAALVAGIVYAVNAPADAPSDILAKSESSQNDSQDNLQLVVAGIARPFASGDSIAVSGDVMAKVIVERGEERYSRVIDLYLYHLATSKPLDDFNVQLTGSMRYMDHGTFRSVPLQSDRGHYILPLAFVMPGEWEVDLDIQVSGKRTKMQIQIDLYQ